VIVGLPAPVKGLHTTSLGAQSLVAAVPARSSMAARGELTLERLDPERLVMLPRDANPALYDAVVALCREAGLAPDFVEASEPRVEAVLLAVAAGARAALPPAFEAAVLSRPDHDSLAIQRFLRTVSHLAKRRPVVPMRLEAAAVAS
jgi:hypothetical protein